MTGPERPIAAAWLALRRSADSAARDRAGWLLDEFATAPGPLIVFDIGAGTGANQAYLQPRLGIESRWVLLDHDVDLLNAPGQGDAERVLGGIEQLDELVAARPGERLITCSALLDLLTVDELDTLAAVLARHRSRALFSLTVDGTLELQPGHRFDADVAAAFNEHQSRGGRPGPAAADHLASRCRQLGLNVRQAETPWLLDGDSAALIERLLTERADAAVEQRPDLATVVGSWLADRRRSLSTGSLTVRVGHADLLITP